MLVEMTKVQIIGTREVLDRAVRALHQAGVAQIEERPPVVESLAPDGEAVSRRDAVLAMLARLDALLALLPARWSAGELREPYDAQSRRPAADILREVQAALAELDAPARELSRRRDQLEADQVTLPRYAGTMRQLAPLAAELAPLRNYETVALLVQRKYGAVVDSLRERLLELTKGECEIVSRDVDSETTAAMLVFPREHAAGVHALLGRESIAQVRLPDELRNVPFKDQLATIDARLAALPDERARIQRELEALAELWGVRLAVWRACLRDLVQQLEVRGLLGATRYTFVAVAWVPRRDLSALRDLLAREVGDEILLEELALTERERQGAPVALSNPAPARPFESLVRLMGLPRYGGVDPTLMMAVFFPLFFGMILGDIAHGAIVFAAAWFVSAKAKSPGLRDLSRAILYGAVWAIAFGAVYGEFFGEAGRRFFGLRAYFARDEAVLPLFALALAFGVAQVSIGFALGIYQAIRLRQRHELVDRVAKVVALAGLFGMAAAAKDVAPRALFTPALVVVMVGTVVLSVRLGWVGILLGPLEVIGVVGHILSYVRLAAIGLASVYLAMVANKLAGVAGNVVIGVIVAVLFHALNVAMGILSPTIQSLRLHYVEFFSKFFEGGGGEFKPFRREGLSRTVILD